MAEEVVGRGIVEILPDFKKFGQQLSNDMKTAAKQARGQIAPIEGAFRDSQGRLRAANGAFIKEYQNGWKAAAKTVATSMAGVGKGVTVIALGVAAASVKMAGDFQAETSVLQTAAGETSKGLAVVRKGILSLASNTGTGIKNLTDGMYTIEKAGYRGAAGLMVLKAAAQGAKEENANLADVTNAMTSVMASYHLKATDSVRVMNSLKTAAGEGKITMEEFAGALSTVIPIASANKISFGEIGGAIATLTQHGTSANEATQELSSTIRQLAAPNNVAVHEMARFGISAQNVALNLGTDKRGLAGTINLLSRTILSKMGPSGKVLLSSFNETTQATQAANNMLSLMPKSLQAVAKQFLDGKISVGDWRATLKDLPVDQANLATQFASLVNKSRGFSDQLKNGGPASKTYTEALKKMSGGAIGLNTILQLTGENTAGLKDRTEKVTASFNHASKNVEGWKQTQGLFNTQIARAKETVQVLAIELGTKLIPIIQSVVSWMGKHQKAVLDLILAFTALLGVMAAMYIAQKLYAVYTLASAIVTGVWNAALSISRTLALGTRIELAALWLWQKAIAISTGIVTAAQWLWNAALTANPITLVVIACVALVAAIVYVATKTTWFQTAWKASWDAIKIAFFAVWGFIKDHWRLILGILTGPVGGAVILIIGHWKQIQKGISETISWVRKNWPLILAIITGPIGLATLYVVNHWRQIANGINSAWSSIRSHTLTPMQTFFTHTVPGWANTLKTKISNAFNDAATGAGKGFRRIESLAKSPISFIVNTVYDKGIVGVWNRVAGAFGATKLSPYKFRAGGPVWGAGTETSDSVPSWLSHNEHVWTAKEVRGAGGHGAVMQMRKWAAAGGGAHSPGFKGGGPFGWIGSAANAVAGAGSAAWNKAKHAAGWIKDTLAASARAGVRAVVNPLINHIPGAGGFGKMVRNIPKHMVDALFGYADKADAKGASASFGGGKIPSGRHMAIIQQALAAAGVPPPGTIAQWSAGMNTLIGRESGWNASAINRTDSNAKAGHPSQGLAQTIPSTFNHYVPQQLRSRGILDPVANVAAAIRYIVSRYGNITRVQQANANMSPKGYDSGGWLPPGLSLAMNGTGRPERIRTAKQEAALNAGGGDTYYFTFTGPVGSQAQLEDWLVKALDTVGRKKRIPPSWKQG